MADGTSVDNLQIEINAKAQSANDSIDKLVGKLERLQGALSGVGSIKTSNITRLTNNLAKLNSLDLSKLTDSTKSISKIADSFNKMGSSKGLNSTNTEITKMSSNTFKLSSVFSQLYTNINRVERAIAEMYSNIESTADYLEAFNYFNVALGKIGSDWSHQFEQYGYESAEAYADSFSTRLQSSLKNLSGLQITLDTDGNGILTETGLKNLGLNIQEITQYASQLASVTNSVGQVGEVSLAAANSLTKLGADLSSLFNLDYSSVMQNLQSGLIGQSRALYKYGIDITNATLQTYAYDLGLEKAVSEMTQAEKMQLRLIAILDQSKVSWGDLANTINSPSNMMRQFSNNLKEVGMVLGQLFIPLMQKVMPIINGVTIALKRLLVNIAGFLGIQLDLSSFGQGYANIGEEVDGLTDSIDNATASAKKLKTVTLGIDELNINAPQDQSGASTGGVGGGIDLTDEILKATEEYEKVWSNAFKNMENKAQEWADRIEKIFEPITKPLQNLFKNISIGDWFSAGQNVSSIASGLFDLFTKAIKKVDWFKLGKNIGKFLSGINWKNILSSAFDAFYETFKGILEGYFGSLSVAPLETAMISLLSISKLNFNKTTKGIKNLSTNLSKLQKTTLGATSVFVEFELLSDVFKDIVMGSNNLLDSLGQIVFVLVGSSAALTKMFGPAGILISGFTAMASVLVGLDNAVDEILGKRAGEAIKNALTVPGGMSLEEISEKYSLLVNEISSGFLSINSASSNMKSTKSNIEEVWLQIEQIKVQMDAGVISVEEGTQKLETLFSELSNITQTYIGDIENSLIMAFGENGAFRKYSDGLGEDISDSLLEAFNITGEMKNRVSELAGLMSDPNISTEEYISYQNELSSILGKTDELSKAITSFSENVSKLDLSDMFSEDGTLNAEKFRDSINGISQSVKDTNQEIDLAGQNIKTYLNTLREQAKTDEEIKAIDNLLSVVEESILNAKSDVKLQAVEFTNVIQTDLIDGINDIISNAKLEGLSDSQIKDIVSRYVEGIEEAGSIISSEIEGSNWSDNITQSLLDELFYFDTVEVEGYVVSDSNVETVLSDNYEEIVKNAIEEATENSKGTFENSGKQSVNSYIDGLVLSRSPLVNKANLLSSDTIKPFKNLESNFSKIGESSIAKMKDGMVLSANGLYDECNKIVSNIQNIFGGATAGITMGLNAVVSKINIPQYAVGGFPEDGLFMANHNELVGQFSNGRTAVANNEQIVAGIKEGVKEAVGEMLTPYLAYLPDIAQSNREVANKDLSVNIGDKEIYKASVRGQKSYGFQLIT